MKFTKKETSDIIHFFNIIKNRINIDKIDSIKIPSVIRTNLITYGLYAGRIIQIIKNKTKTKDESKLENADEIIKEMFGEDFFNWISEGHKKFTYKY